MMDRGRNCSVFLGVFVAAALALNSGRAVAADAVGRADAKVFEGPAATMTPDIFLPHEKPPMLRVLTVQERRGAARKNELVRVPLFFHEGECADPNALTIVSAGPDKTPIPYQADDIRRDESGKVARMHIYFLVDLEPWQRKQFQLLPGKNPGASLPALPVTETSGKVTLAGQDMQLTFLAGGPRAGAIAGIGTPAGKVLLPQNYVGPAVQLFRQGSDLNPQRQSDISYDSPETLEIRDLRWSSGPLFSKLIVRTGPRGLTDNAEFIYLVPKFGSEFTQTELLFPTEKDSSDTVGSKENALLRGKIVIGDDAADQQILKIPAGLRQRTRQVFNYYDDVLVNPKSGISLFMVPFVEMGARGIARSDDGTLAFSGSKDFQTHPGSNSGSLRVFFGQVRFIFSKAVSEEDLWHLGVKSFQPLTAAVDEPWATPARYDAMARAVGAKFWSIDNWGRPPEAVMAMTYLSRDDSEFKALLARLPEPGNQHVQNLIPTQEDIAGAWKKTQGAGALDPWGITYSRSAIALMSAFIHPDKSLDRESELTADACRLVNGRIDKYGWPHVRSFSDAVNMHVGTYLLGIWGGRKDGNSDILRWCLDATQNQALLGNYGHAQRPYSMDVGSGYNSDQLYLSVTDFWLRAIELTCNEDLNLHPGIYGRYFDCVDVNADVYQRRILSTGGSQPSWWRATQFRGQAHDHRWEAYGCDPCLGMLEIGPDGSSAGVTEAAYFLHREIEKQPGYNFLMQGVFFPDVLLTRGVGQYRPALRPALPENLKIAHNGSANVLTWNAVPGKDILGYRVYRTDRVGGPWTWLNSPYKDLPAFVPPTNAQRPAPHRAKKGESTPPVSSDSATPWVFKNVTIPETLIKGTSYTDSTGTADSVYFVTAEDANRRASRWFPDEPLPTAAK